MLDGKTIIVVAADQGLRRSVAFALEVEGYATQSYDTLRAAEDASRLALCAIVDDDILRSEPQAAAQFLSNRGGGAILLVDGLSALQRREDYATLTKPFTGADLLGVINSLVVAAK
ncbi:transcriptional regulator [Sinorhizobium meliloti]|uniref:transcriptional regulator n=1 Tax=Rhizobium meliloti TaxID=382 RepID=UPI00299F2205|nr:transcriptional regulator [Sinorhizobium meliloti]MDW9875608.1 transcriptional regulator [Sinorhizobium meliloti]MDW9887824.1 transcriptional regulator [Sinorhizobium meliloti]MDX0210071.1 transcriptional regulator [Sinorhizobium meliloti]